MACKHLYYKTEHLKNMNIGGLCRNRWTTGFKCYKNGLEKLCRGYEYEEKEIKAVEVAVQETGVQGVPEAKPEISEPINQDVREEHHAHRGRPAKQKLR
jgi:hypothetical protein